MFVTIKVRKETEQALRRAALAIGAAIALTLPAQAQAQTAPMRANPAPVAGDAKHEKWIMIEAGSGATADSGFERQIDVLSFSFGTTQSGARGSTLTISDSTVSGNRPTQSQPAPDAPTSRSLGHDRITIRGTLRTCQVGSHMGDLTLKRGTTSYLLKDAVVAECGPVDANGNYSYANYKLSDVIITSTQSGGHY